MTLNKPQQYSLGGLIAIATGIFMPFMTSIHGHIISLSSAQTKDVPIILILVATSLLFTAWNRCDIAALSGLAAAAIIFDFAAHMLEGVTQASSYFDPSIAAYTLTSGCLAIVYAGYLHLTTDFE